MVWCIRSRWTLLILAVISLSITGYFILSLKISDGRVFDREFDRIELDMDKDTVHNLIQMTPTHIYDVIDGEIVGYKSYAGRGTPELQWIGDYNKCVKLDYWMVPNSRLEIGYDANKKVAHKMHVVFGRKAPESVLTILMDWLKLNAQN